ncbi:retropepsin-like aspartic protease [Aureisphaera galaxeae]|uniref:retropepsin-like aspartic protease n=1 Tax=Aureisphaera galaxeae TaxID=1538023 RepID=UPI00234FE7DE|nr:retropepsin-like aspartic protease [Aureisphaera galaxeae]MDC8004697.1 retropepsin-like aspartic protease [Aureisphaera galaxeae]
MKKALLTLIAFHVLFLSCGQEKANIVIPIDMSSHRPVMDVMIDGKGPYNFIFDTGSTTNVIDENLQETFEFKVVGEDPLTTPGSKNQLFSKRVTVPKVNFPETSITQTAEMNVIALRKMLPVDGIIGGFFFEEYLVTMDYPSSKLILAKGQLDKNDPDVVPFIQDARTLNLTIDVAGHNAEAHLDSGNPLTMTLPHSLMDKLTFKEAPRKGEPMRTPVASFDTWEAQLLGDVTIGNAVIKNPHVRLAEGYKYVNIGYGVINQLRTTIDRKNSLIKFEKMTQTQGVNKVAKKDSGVPTSPYTGTYEGDRKIWIDDAGKLVYKRTPAPIPLEMVRVGVDLFEMKIPDGVRAPQEIPRVQFNRNSAEQIVSITLVYKDGRKDGPYKKIKT